MPQMTVTALILALVAASVSANDRELSLAGRWRYLQPPDAEGEVLELRVSSGQWIGIMNGLERMGEHGLYYYVVEVESLEVTPGGAVRFAVGERTLFRRRPPLSRLGEIRDDAGLARDRLRFAGRLEALDLVLRCIGSCPDTVLRFQRIAAGPGLPRPARRDTAFAVALRLSVLDSTPSFERSIGPGLRIQVRNDPPLGWSVSVVSSRPSNKDPSNLLHHSRDWHGPHPSDVYAWSYASRFYSDERILPVFGRPHEVRIRLVDCRTSGAGEEAVFVDGSIEVAWRRTSAPRDW